MKKNTFIVDTTPCVSRELIINPRAWVEREMRIRKGYMELLNAIETDSESVDAAEMNKASNFQKSYCK